MTTAKQVLKECQLFSALNDAQVEKVAVLASEKQYEAGTTLLREGDTAEELFIIQEGRVALQMMLPETQESVGRRLTIDVATTNDVVGWSAVVEPYIYTMTAVCLQKVKALAINGARLRRLLHDNYEIGYQVMDGLVKVVAARLDDTRQVLISERLLAGTKSPEDVS